MTITDKKPLKFNRIQKTVLLFAFIALIGILIYIKIKPDLQIMVNKQDVIVTETTLKMMGRKSLKSGIVKKLMFMNYFQKP